MLIIHLGQTQFHSASCVPVCTQTTPYAAHITGAARRRCPGRAIRGQWDSVQSKAICDKALVLELVLASRALAPPVGGRARARRCRGRWRWNGSPTINTKHGQNQTHECSLIALKVLRAHIVYMSQFQPASVEQKHWAATGERRPTTNARWERGGVDGGVDLEHRVRARPAGRRE